MNSPERLRNSLENARKFCITNLPTLCKEVIEWKVTSRLPDRAHLRELARLYNPVASTEAHALNLAEAEVTHQAMLNVVERFG